MKKITLLMLIVFTIAAHGQNKLLSSINEQYYNSTWNNSSGSNYEYDSNNNLIAETYVNWNSNGAWEIKTKTSYTYNANNKVTEELYKSSWDSPTNTLENSYKDTYTYTGGKLTEAIYYEWISSNWVIDGKTVVTYTNNLPTGFLWYDWDGMQWVNEERVTLSYNANNKLTSEVTEEWIGSQWVNSYKTLYTYDSNNKMISYKSAEWDEFNTIWVENGDKTEYDWDATGNKTRQTEYYEYADSSLAQNKDEYTYDTFNLMSSFAHPFKDKTGLDYISEDVPHINKVQGYNSYSYNQSTSNYNPISSKTTYNYNNSITLSTKKPEIADEKTTVFPNPTTDFLTIQNSSNAVIDKVIVTDISGKKILQQNQNTTRIDVQNLAKGMYILEIVSGNKKQQSKFLKE